MPDIIGIAEASMRSGMLQLDTVSRNVANANTQGYKREIHLNRGFESHFPAPINGASALGDAIADGQIANLNNTYPTSSDPSAQGTRAEAYDFSAGALKYTGSPLNIAIEGHGYFQVQTPQGIALTRDGQFKIDQRGRLVAADGAPVLMKGSLLLDESTLSNAELKVLPDGTLRIGDQEAQLDIVDADPAVLQPVGANRYRANATFELPPHTSHLRQGFIEGSNVDTLSEMVEMMGALRHVESSQQVIRAYDGIIESAVSTLGQF